MVFGWFSLLMSTFTIILDYINGEKNCKDPLLLYDRTGQWVKYRPFLSKYYDKVV